MLFRSLEAEARNQIQSLRAQQQALYRAKKEQSLLGDDDDDDWDDGDDGEMEVIYQR